MIHLIEFAAYAADVVFHTAERTLKYLAAIVLSIFAPSLYTAGIPPLPVVEIHAPIVLAQNDSNLVVPENGLKQDLFR